MLAFQGSSTGGSSSLNSGGKFKTPYLTLVLQWAGPEVADFSMASLDFEYLSLMI